MNSLALHFVRAIYFVVVVVVDDDVVDLFHFIVYWCRNCKAF